MKPQYGLFNSLLWCLKEKHGLLDNLSVEISEYNKIWKGYREKFNDLKKQYEDGTADARKIVDTISAIQIKCAAFNEKLTRIYSTQWRAYSVLMDFKKDCERNGDGSNMDINLMFVLDENVEVARDMDMSAIQAKWKEFNFTQKLKDCIEETDKLNFHSASSKSPSM